ncbi:hypothetical protein GQ44DRAFT_733105 [Phaeosphaeriaceae sp. PMI808]|nr:hypothetical protein GQ44DRAFT_733105 [Phaeosphaeriaceae sp. PMI808]
MAVEVNCSIPTPYLLISKAFSNELLCTLALRQEVRVDAGSVYDSLNDMVALWAYVPARRTCRLSVHIRNTLDLGYRTHWKRQYRCGLCDGTYEKVMFFINALSSSAVNALGITLDLPELQPAKNVLQPIINTVAGGEADIVLYKDRWNGFICQKVVFAIKKECGQLVVTILVRSRI